MSAPETIWVIADKGERGERQPCGLWRSSEIQQSDTDKLYHHAPVKYVRADLAPDPRIAALVDAAQALVDYLDSDEEEDFISGDLRAALAALKGGTQ